MFQILVAEDDKNTRRLMEAVLKEHGYHPILACDGLEALKLLDTHHVDLVILDIMMPGMDGYEFTRQLRATDYTRPFSWSPPSSCRRTNGRDSSLEQMII